MRIGIVGSMQFTKKMLETKQKLQEMGHEAYITSLAEPFIGKTDEEKEEIKLQQKKDFDVIKEFWDLMQGGDAILVLNFDKRGIKNYVGGNALMEIGFAHVLGQKVFLYNSVPEIDFYKSEIESVNPTIINGDLKRIR